MHVLSWWQYFFTINFKHFDVMELFSSNSNSNIRLEILSIKDFLVDFSVKFLLDLIACRYILFMALNLLKFSSSKLILINLQSSSSSISFLLFHHYLYHNDQIHQLLWQACDQEKKDQNIVLSWSLHISSFKSIFY